jgi:hypothetical protein
LAGRLAADCSGLPRHGGEGITRPRNHQQAALTSHIRRPAVTTATAGTP